MFTKESLETAILINDSLKTLAASHLEASGFMQSTGWVKHRASENHGIDLAIKVVTDLCSLIKLDLEDHEREQARKERHE
jgi:hypothetical protein